MGVIRVFYRLSFFIAYTALAALQMYVCRRWLGHGRGRIMAMRRRWARCLLQATGVRVRVEGNVPSFPVLLMANHRSYLDPILLLRDVHAYPVAKAELARWPLIGRGAQQAGIIYLKRDRVSSGVHALRAIADIILREGFSVILFPEGTTSSQMRPLTFKKGAFRAAARWQLPVVPVAICFSDEQDFWVGEEPFLRHAWRRFQKREISVCVCYGPTFRYAQEEVLEQQVRSWLETQLCAFYGYPSAP